MKHLAVFNRDKKLWFLVLLLLITALVVSGCTLGKKLQPPFGITFKMNEKQIVNQMEHYTKKKPERISILGVTNLVYSAVEVYGQQAREVSYLLVYDKLSGINIYFTDNIGSKEKPSQLFESVLKSLSRTYGKAENSTTERGYFWRNDDVFSMLKYDDKGEFSLGFIESSK